MSKARLDPVAENQSQPSGARLDPTSRPVEATTPLWVQLKNRDPKRHYVFVHEQNGGLYDVGYYQAIAEGLGMAEDEGYVLERQRPGGVRLTAGNTSRGQDEPIRYRGMVLVSCPIEFKKLIDDIGIDGQSGQKGADHIWRATQRRGSADDPKIAIRSQNGTDYIRPLGPAEI